MSEIVYQYDCDHCGSRAKMGPEGGPLRCSCPDRVDIGYDGLFVTAIVDGETWYHRKSLAQEAKDLKRERIWHEVG